MNDEIETDEKDDALPDGFVFVDTTTQKLCPTQSIIGSTPVKQEPILVKSMQEFLEIFGSDSQ